MFKERLKAARIKSGLSLRGLEDKMGKKVSAQAIGKYERGEMHPSPSTLELLASTLGVQKESLISTQTIQIGTIEFRENKLIRSKSDEKIVNSTISYNLMRYLKIEELVNPSLRDWDKPRGYPFVVKDLHEAEWSAHKVRDEWSLGNDSIPNLCELLEERGFKVILVDLPSSIAGVTCFIENNLAGNTPVIVTSKSITGERQRFTIAHELAHLLLEFTDNISNTERACDKFAGALLMPERAMKEALGQSRKSISVGELVALKRFLGVSVQALTYRARDLGIITDYTYKNLYSEFSRRGWLKPPFAEPLPVPLEEPQRFKRLCLRALAEDIIDEETAAELLDVSLEDIRNEYNARTGDASKAKHEIFSK
jgi:Zn-dependent peptidase ImmA (M78 family)